MYHAHNFWESLFTLKRTISCQTPGPSIESYWDIWSWMWNHLIWMSQWNGNMPPILNIAGGCYKTVHPPQKCGTNNHKDLGIKHRKNWEHFFYSTKRHAIFRPSENTPLHFAAKKARSNTLLLQFFSSVPIVKGYWFHCYTTKEIPTKLLVLYQPLAVSILWKVGLVFIPHES